MSYLKAAITPVTVPTITQVIRYKANNSIIIKPLNKISIAQHRGGQ